MVNADASTVDPPHRQLGLTDEEFARIHEILGRPPTDLELAMYGVMWSEHCSYKSSAVYLSRFPSDAPWVLVGPGEGAGVIDVGDGLAIAIRIESHNHPSAVEPYQGAATGVGGIIRDVFSMGARPIALMDSLRFGSLDEPRNRFLFEGVVSGISGYGNAVGVPTVGGEVVFDDTYADNPLVNVLCLGVLPHQRLVLARADEEGHLAVLLGASTGRDGIGGASVLASAGFEAGADDKRPSVQVGDPFEEKKLIEACLALLGRGLAEGVQDLGAAGLACACSETAAKGSRGMDVDLARVPRREPGMDPAEVMTSESQERMLVIVRPERLPEVMTLCEEWEISASVIGQVTDTGRMRVYDGLLDAPSVPSTPLADVPAASLGDGPRYRRSLGRPPDHDARAAADPWAVLEGRFPAGAALGEELLALLGSPSIADTSWVWRQYDHQLFLNTVTGPGGDASVLRLRDPDSGRATTRALALTTDGNGRFCRLDPRTGGRLAVLEALRNIACVGGVPKAVVNCLNFGNPEHAPVMWQFAEVVEGISQACEALGVPVVGGNVSFYNESHGRDIDPTPVIGALGIIEDVDRPLAGIGAPPGSHLVVLGTTAPELGGSEWAATLHGLDGGMPPAADLAAAARLHRLVAGVARDPSVLGVHDCSEGGLAVCLAEMAIAGQSGVRVVIGAVPGGDGIAPAAVLFSESANRVVLAVHSDGVEALLAAAADAGVPAADIGEATGDRLVVGGCIDLPLAAVAASWRDAIPSRMDAAVTH